MSSAALVDAFFPTSAAIIDAWPGLRDLLLSPPWARRACPAPAAVVAGVVSIAWPSLLTLTLASVPLALCLAAKLERAARRSSKQQQEELRLWRDACALFAGMNAAAAFAHSLLPPLLPSSPLAAALAWPLRLARAADVAFTGASSSFLIAASAARRAARRRGGSEGGDGGGSARPRPRHLAPRRAALVLAAIALLGNAVPASVAARFAAGPPPAAALPPPLRLATAAARAALAQGQLPFANEVAYLLPTLLAALLLSLSDVPSAGQFFAAARRCLFGGNHDALARSRLWAAAAGTIALLGLVAIGLDGPLCALAGKRGFDWGLNGATLLFACCDGAFVCLSLYAVVAAKAQQQQRGGGKARRPVHVVAVAASALSQQQPPGTPAAAAKARHALAAAAADAAAGTKKLF